MPTSTTNNRIPYNQQEALAIGYAQYALMHTLTQQSRMNYPVALLHAAAASGYLSFPSSMMANTVAATATANSNTNRSKISIIEKSHQRRKLSGRPENDSNNNHIQSSPSVNDQPYRRETYQTLLESSRLLGQHQQQKLPKPVPIDLRKQNKTNRTVDSNRFCFLHETNYYVCLFRSCHIKLSLFTIITNNISTKFTIMLESFKVD